MFPLGADGGRFRAAPGDLSTDEGARAGFDAVPDVDLPATSLVVYLSSTVASATTGGTLRVGGGYVDSILP